MRRRASTTSAPPPASPKAASFITSTARKTWRSPPSSGGGATTANLFAATAYRELPDPLDRLLAYVDFRKALIRGEAREFTCFAGTTVQEVHETHPAIRDACGETILGHAATLEADIAAAMRQYGAAGTWTARSLALHTQAVIQGAFVLAKATQDPTIAIASLDHLRRYLELLFRPPQPKEKTP
jgi:TetR/AcrR family transcriptional repressor of nem operon